MSSLAKTIDSSVALNLVLPPDSLDFDSELDASFSGTSPSLTGTETAFLGADIADYAGLAARSSTLVPLLAASHVVNPNAALAIDATVAGSGGLDPTKITIGLSATGNGFAAVLGPILNTLGSSPVGNGLGGLDQFLQLIVPGLGDPYIPTTGYSTHAAADLAIFVSKQNGNAASASADGVAKAGLAATRFATGAQKLGHDLATGALSPALADAGATMSNFASLARSYDALSAGAPPVAAPVFAAPVAVDVQAEIAGGAHFAVPFLGTASVSYTVDVGISGDQAGAYALGHILAAATANKVASAGGPLQELGAIAGAFGKLLLDTATTLGEHGTTSATTTPSSVDKTDVFIDLGIGVTEKIGFLTTTHHFELGLAGNASGALKIGADLAPLIDVIAPALLKSPLGNEIVGIAGSILNQANGLLGVGGTVPTPDALKQIVALAHHNS